MLVGKIKSEEDLLKNGFTAVESKNKTVNRYKVEVFDREDNTYIVRSVQGECLIPIPVRGGRLINGTLKYIMECLNSNNYKFYHYSTGEEI